MKRRYLLGLCGALLLAPVGRADTIRLADGRVLQEARVVSVSAGRVCIRHAAGLVQVDRALLPPELAALYPADPQAVASEDTKRAEGAERQAAKDERETERFREAVRRAPSPAAPVAVSAGAIRAAAEGYAEDYFRNKYRSGNNDALTMSVMVETEAPEPMAGWLDQWRVSGEASFSHYRSSGWGSFQRESRRFEAVVYAPAGERPAVKDFVLR